MAGLMEKDFRILLQRKQAFLVFLVIAVLLSVTQGGAGVVGYLPFISAMLAVSTISYDEFDNGYPFLFTLPITRKSYVAEKYIFCFLTVFCSWIFSVILYVAIDKLQGGATPVSEMLFVSILLLLIAIVLMDVMVAVQLKYGSERSRVVIIAIFGICFKQLSLVKVSGFGKALFKRASNTFLTKRPSEILRTSITSFPLTGSL